MKLFSRGLALLFALLMLLNLASCGGDNTTTPALTTPRLTTSDDDPMRPGDSTPNDSTSGGDSLLPDPGTMPGADTTPSDQPATPNPGDIVLDNADALLEQGIRIFREVDSVRQGHITSEATMDGVTSAGTTNFRFAREGRNFMAHTDSGSDTSEVIVVENIAYVRIGDLVMEKTTFADEQYDAVLFATTLSVLDALEPDSFSEISATREADGGVRVVCRGVASRESEKLEAVLNTVNMDMSDVLDAVECVFLLDEEGRIVRERCEISATVGAKLRTDEHHTVDLRLLVEADCVYPKEMTIFPPTDAELYSEVEFHELFH